jgi:class 3 adenylate cyclase
VANFRQLFEESLKTSRELRKSTHRDVRDSQLPAIQPLGHPEYEELSLMATAESKSVVFFLDVRGFTKLSFVLENGDLLDILQALTEASIKAISSFRGYVGEFTGDGIMAYFGDSRSTQEEAALSGLMAASMLMRGVKEVVNPQLGVLGHDPIRVAVGMEYGDVLWSRIGLPTVNQVKAVSDVTFLAGKLATSRFTNAWECKVGERLAAWIPDEFKRPAEAYSFQYDQKKVSHGLFYFDWERFSVAYGQNPQVVRQRFIDRKIGSTAISATSVTAPAAASGPKKLKDQPFF